ncbi:hypothetical protein HYPSUDRAFT_143836 [Hypholoma sublateritium FD-334 SS-4]|uniref:Hydrophobin n=1 Tax=Hypholoma sublateritium (strain FD-334 SS-4) TaxID=945553 RepID=A0A0D2KXX2_HYPSF|nr:hypothetical protein HYPSUDRAFT_143836 [Hypholoma sublateritium FD-334 SS-4]
MQFTTLSTLTTLALAAFASADGASSQCNTGSIQCCNSVHDAQSASLAGLFSVLSIAVESVTGQVGVTCSPITAVGAGGNACTQQAVCCSNNSFNGVVALGCTPININL